MMKVLRCGIAIALVGGAVVALTSVSEATSVPAFIGQPQQAADYACFTNTFGRVSNVCTTTRQFCMALPVTSGSHTVQVSAQAADVNHNVSCFAQAVTSDFFDAGHTPSPVSPATFPGIQLLNLGTFNLPANAYLFACCNIAPSPNTIVTSVIY